MSVLPSPSPPCFSLWWLTAEDTCGGTLRGSSGLISSFDIPSGDSPGAGGGGGAGGLGSSGECKWTILADPGDTISLVFTEFQMEEKSDYLEVEGSEPPTIWWVELWGGIRVCSACISSDEHSVVILRILITDRRYMCVWVHVLYGVYKVLTERCLWFLWGCMNKDAGLVSISVFDSCIGWRKITCTKFSQENNFNILILVL